MRPTSRRFLLHPLAAALGLALAAPSRADTPAEPREELPPVVVRGAQRSAAGKLTLTREELRSIPGSAGDPMKAVLSLPGVTVLDDASASPAVRGARPEDNLYQVDFVPVGYLFHLGGLTSVFHPELISRFELASAAWSPEYGDVVGAVFDIGLRDPRRDRVHGVFEFGLLGASALVEGPISSELSGWLAARRSWFDLVAKTGEDKEEGVNYTVPVYHDAQARLLWTPRGGQRLRLDFSTAGDRLDFTYKPDGRAGQRDPVLIGNNAQRLAYRSLALTWEADWGPAGSSTVSLGQTRDRNAASLSAAGRYTLQRTDDFLRAQWQTQWNPTLGVTLGGSLTRRRLDLDLDLRDPRCTEFDPNCDLSSAPRVTSLQRSHQDQADLYGQFRWRLAPAWTATGGVRVSHDQLLRRQLTEPRAGLEWAWSRDTLISLGLGAHHQPGPAEQVLHDVGNPRLLPVRSRAVVLGWSQTGRDGWSWRAEAYAKTFDDLALADPALRYRNGGSGHARGVEALVKKEWGQGWSGFVSVSLSEARRRNELTGERFRMAYDQPVIITAVGQYQLNARWKLGARWSVHSGSLDTPIVGTGTYPDGRVRPIYGALNSTRLPTYHRLDLRADARYSERLSAYFELINAYGRKNVAGYSYAADYRSREPIYQLGLVPSAGIQYRY